MPRDINYTESFVAFLDILGFKSLIQAAADASSAAAIITRLRTALQDAKQRIRSKWSWEVSAMDTRMFSDCVCISTPARIENFDAFFQCLALVQANLFREAILLRGGIAIGNHYSDDLLIFSEGLVRAYEIESTKARFPRIIVPQEFWSFVVGHGYDEDIIWFKDTYIWHDPADGSMFVDYLNWMPYDRRDDPHHNGADLRRHRSFIMEGLEKCRASPSVSEKYRWMAWYHNAWCISEYPDHPDILIPPESVAK